MDLTEFVKARFDEWERRGRAARPHQTGSRDEGQPPDHVSWRRGPGSVEFGLRHVATLRVIVELHDRVHDCPVIIPTANPRVYAGNLGYVSTEHVDGEDRDVSPCTTLRALAADWSTHPDYRAEWAPES